MLKWQWKFKRVYSTHVYKVGHWHWHSRHIRQFLRKVVLQGNIMFLLGLESGFVVFFFASCIFRLTKDLNTKPNFSVHHIFSLLVPIKKGIFRNVSKQQRRRSLSKRWGLGGGGAHQRVFHRRNRCPWLPLPKFDHCLVSSVGRAPICWARCLLAQANLFVIFTVSSVKIAICKQCVSRHLSRRSWCMVLFR